MNDTADILLITATETETRAVLDVAHQQTQQPWTRRPFGGNVYYDLGVVSGARLFLVQSAMGALGLGAAGQTVQQGIEALHPIAVIMVGIAFGMQPRTQRIGDVLVARQILLYEPQKVARDASGQPQILPRGTRADVSPWLLKAFRSGIIDWSPPTQPTQGVRPPQVQAGLILSGEKLIDNLTFRDQLGRNEPEAIGGEMEGGGLYVAAHQGRVDWIVVKAICDWADGTKDRRLHQRQRQAAHNAAHFVFHVIEQGAITRATAPHRPSPPPALPHPSTPAGNAPPLPALMLGRDADVLALKARLGIGKTISGATHVLTAMRGWPGVGKTTLVSALAHDQEVMRAFPDGVLWASLGQQPNVFAELAAWGRALGVPDLNQARTTAEVSALLRGLLRNQRRLLIVDDAWQAEHVLPFAVGGTGCALLVTSRLPEVARQIAPQPTDIYVLGVLAPEDALLLLRTLAPNVVGANETTCRELVADLEGLPLALQVAGRLLHTEAGYGFGVTQLLADIRAGAAVIAAQAPADRADIANQTTPTVAALLALSTNHLDDVSLERFAYLGVFAPKPATFDLPAMEKVWDVTEAQPTVRMLVDRGLLEPSGEGRFWMHAILVAHAKSFWAEE